MPVKYLGCYRHAGPSPWRQGLRSGRSASGAPQRRRRRGLHLDGLLADAPWVLAEEHQRWPRPHHRLCLCLQMPSKDFEKLLVKHGYYLPCAKHIAHNEHPTVAEEREQPCLSEAQACQGLQPLLQADAGQHFVC